MSEGEPDIWACLTDRQHDLLHLPSEEPAVLRRVLNRVLYQLALIPVSSAGKIEGNEIARLKPEAGPPRRVDNETDRFVQDFDRAETNAGRLAVILEAQERLVALKYAPARDDVGLRRGTLDWKIAIGTDARPTAVVAQVYGVPAKTVRNYRRRYRPQEAA